MKKLLEQIKLVSGSPKYNVFAFIQTVCENIEGFIKHNVKEMHLTHKV